MNELNSLQSLGLTLPSPTYLVGALIFGVMGYLAFKRGRKTQRTALTWTGLVLMLYPYAVTETWMLGVVGALLTAWVFVKWN